ncbi:MAG: hypothetical protein L6R45_19425 [Anaerolineae bacterium]|nr:hypothetical protein [Anaerolineae bacterium]
MEKISIYVKDKEKAQMLSELLMALDFVEAVNTASEEIEPVSTSTGEVSDFFALAGLWEGREITLNSIRQRAWPRQSS